MRKVFLGGLPAFQFHLLQKFSDEVEHAVFTRKGGVSKPPFDSLNVRFGVGDKDTNVKKNRALICKALQIPPENLISSNQTHSNNVAVIDEEFMRFHPPMNELEDCDAFVTRLPGIALMVQIADCQGILMFDPVKKVIAAVHAGWKGLVKDISFETVKIMRRDFGVDPRNLLAGISPSLGPESAFFSDPFGELPKSFQRYIDEKSYVDFWSYSVDQLKSHGVLQRNIEPAKICTQKNEGGRFYSFRGEHGITGRFGVVIMLRPQK
jgi:YfiH family protein